MQQNSRNPSCYWGCVCQEGRRANSVAGGRRTGPSLVLVPSCWRSSATLLTGPPSVFLSSESQFGCKSLELFKQRKFCWVWDRFHLVSPAVC